MASKRGLKLDIQAAGAQDSFKARVPQPCAACAGECLHAEGESFPLVPQHTWKTPAFLSVPLLPRPQSS